MNARNKLHRIIRVLGMGAAAAVLMICNITAETALAGIEQKWEGKIIAGIQIEWPAKGTRNQYWEQVVRDLIQVREGGLYTSEAMLKSLSILNDSGLFARIEVADPVTTPEDRLLLKLDLQLHDRVKGINIQGHFPYFTKEISNVMSVRPGDVFTADLLSRQAPRIVSFLKKEGYIDPRVTVDAVQDSDDGHYMVNVRIEKGDYFKVKSVDFEGLEQIKPHQLNIKTRRMKGDRLNLKQVREDQKKILSACRKAGFADANVTFTTRTSEAESQAQILFKVDEGPKYEAIFTGNTAFGSRALKKEIAWFDEGDRHGFGVKKTVRRIRKVYTQNGYIKARVTVQIEEKKEGTKRIKEVVFNIDEGRQHLVSNLVIKGGKTIDSSVLREKFRSGTKGILQQPVYDPQILESDIHAVKELYLNNGFSETVVERRIGFKEPDGPDTGKNVLVEIVIRIEEGPQTLISGVRFTGFPDMGSDRVLALISSAPGKPFRRFMLESDENVLKSNISERGYPHVSVTANTNLSPDRTRAEIEFVCTPGPLVKMGRVIYAGNFRTQPAVLDDEIDPGVSEPLSLKRVMEIRRNLSDVASLEAIRFRTPGLKEKASTVHVVAEVMERKPYFVEVETGFDTRRRVYARSEAGDRNFLGRSLNLSGGGEISQIGYHFDVGLKDPNFMGRQVSSEVRVFIEELEELNKDFGTRSIGVSQKFSWQFFNGDLDLSLDASYWNQELYALSPAFFNEDPDRFQGKRAIVGTGPSITYRTTDSFVRPTRGIFTTADIDISKGLDDDMDSFIRYRIDYRRYYSPLKRLTLAFRGRYGLVQSYGNRSDIPEDQLFFLGGTSSVRGFDENMLLFDEDGNAVGGKQMVSFSAEARVDISEKFELAFFADTGRISSSGNAKGSDEFRSSAGVGIRYHTPIGPISLLYGHKLDPKPGEADGSTHFSVGYTF